MSADGPVPGAEGVRLAKRLAAERGCSRREAEQLVEGGWVAVDGVVVEAPGARVAPGQRIEVAEGARAQDIPPVTLLLHKPAGCDLQAAQALLEPQHQAQGLGPPVRVLLCHFRGLVPCTPLPAAASGMVVFTQDRRVSRHFEERPALEHECLAEVRGTADAAALAPFARGAHGLPAARMSWQSEQRLRIALQGPHLQAVPALCAALGLELLQWRLVRIGSVPLAKLPPGQWRYAQPWERF